MLCEISQIENDKYYMTSPICGIKKPTMNIPHRSREQIGGCQNWGLGSWGNGWKKSKYKILQL